MSTVNPIHQFEVHNSIVINFLNKFSFAITNLQFSFIIVGFIILFLGIFFKYYSTVVPTKLQTFFESIIGAIDGIIDQGLAKDAQKYKPLVFSLFFDSKPDIFSPINFSIHIIVW